MVDTSSDNLSAESAKVHLAKRLQAEGARCLAFFSALSPETWERGIYTEGARWTVRQVLAHFVATERALRTLVGQILAGSVGAPRDFDIDRFNEAQVKQLDTESPSALMDLFQEERERTLAIVENLEPAQLMRKGRHPYFGSMTVQQLLKWIYQHGQVHLRDIRNASTGERID